MNILLGFFGLNDNQEIRNKYFKIEPIFVVHEKHYDYTYYDAGTASEIMNGLSSRTDSKKSTGPYFVRGGNNIGVRGDWNVIRNYIISIYFTCESRKSSGLSDAVACYDSIKMGDIAEKKEKKVKIQFIVTVMMTTTLQIVRTKDGPI
ncbi:MAG: hypothetical protein IJE04_03425 [Bacilli bacterium]|nr:hypothetical protein [Bacilli bacterium]